MRLTTLFMVCLALVCGTAAAQMKSLDSTAATGLTFATGSTSPTTERMRIGQTGNVGIGTSSPNAQLDVNGTISATTIVAAPPMMILVDEKASGTAGGTCTAGSWMTRDINSVEHNSITGASLSSNQITLPAGKYLIRGAAPAHRTGLFKTRLYNVTDAATAIVGRSSFSYNSAGYDVGFSDFSGVVTITAAKAFRLEARCSITQATSGMGLATSLDTEVYSTLEITKLQ